MRIMVKLKKEIAELEVGNKERKEEKETPKLKEKCENWPQKKLLVKEDENRKIKNGKAKK